MDFTLPVSLLNNLKCYICDKFVSVGPVSNTPNGEIICGRCQQAPSKYQNVAFEIISSLFDYPCCYWKKGCPVVLKWNAIQNHEWNCSYRMFEKISHSRLMHGSTAAFSNDNQSIYNLSQEDLKNLRCVLCHRYLSSFPVYLMETGESVCHRCPLPKREFSSPQLNLAYVKIASIIRFPCMNQVNGCPIKKVFGKEHASHEQSCTYKDNPLPLKNRQRPENLPMYQNFNNDVVRPLSRTEINQNNNNYSNRAKDAHKQRVNERPEPNYKPHGSNVEQLRQHAASLEKLQREGSFKPKENIYSNNRNNSFAQHNDYSPYDAPLNDDVFEEVISDYQKKQVSVQVTDNKHFINHNGEKKQRGVIQTHRGHVYATITPNSQLFAPPPTKHAQKSKLTKDVADEFQDILKASGRNRNSESEHPQRADDDFTPFRYRPERNEDESSKTGYEEVDNPAKKQPQSFLEELQKNFKKASVE